MAFTAVVDRKARGKIRELLRDVADNKGNFYLAMLAQTSPELADRWSLIVSAPWIDSSGPHSAVSYLSSKLATYLDRNSLSAIDRISTIPSDQILEKVGDSLKVALDDPETHMRNWQFGSWFIPDGYVFVANPRPRNTVTRSARHQSLRH